MPSVGISSVGAVVNFLVAASILIDGSCREKSVTRLRVANLLVTSTTGAFSLAFHSATAIPAPYFPSVALRTCALPDQLLPSTFWKSPSTEGSGIHARGAPSGFRISTRVVISKVRQLLAFGSKGSCCEKATRGRDPSTDAAAPA